MLLWWPLTVEYYKRYWQILPTGWERVTKGTHIYVEHMYFVRKAWWVFISLHEYIIIVWKSDGPFIVALYLFFELYKIKAEKGIFILIKNLQEAQFTRREHLYFGVDGRKSRHFTSGNLQKQNYGICKLCYETSFL